jgi:transcriptional regulator with XRE-family HTH domain
MSIDKFWKRLKAELKAQKISQIKFAEQIQIPRSTFLRWQQVSLIPDAFTAYTMAAALGVSLEYLITGENRKTEKLRMEQTEVRKSTELEVKKLVGKLQQEVVKF